MLAAHALAGLLGRGVLRLQGIDPAGKPSPISGIMVAILLGMAVANTVAVPRLFRPGLDFAMKKVLRLGIILVGIRLSAFDVVALGALAVPVVATIVVVALVVTPAFARRVGVSEGFGTLTAAATAICGVTAALAVAPVIEADDREVAYTVANVTLFGALAMFVDPYLAHALFGGTSASVGLFLGTGIHDTSQVMGAALSYKELFHDERALKVATVTKLTRNLFLAAVVPVLAFLHARRPAARHRQAARPRSRRSLPLFVLGFLAMARPVGRRRDARPRERAWGIWEAAAWARLDEDARGDLGGRRSRDGDGRGRADDALRSLPRAGSEAALRRRRLGHRGERAGAAAGGDRRAEDVSRRTGFRSGPRADSRR